MENFVLGLLCVIAVVLGLLCVIAVVWLTIVAANVVWKVEAADHGKAEFYLDNNYNRQWRWLP